MKQPPVEGEWERTGGASVRYGSAGGVPEASVRGTLRPGKYEEGID